MSAPQRGLDDFSKSEPQPGTGYMPLMLGYVLKSDRTKRTIDVVLRGGGKLFNVPVVSLLSGVPYLPTISNATGEPTGEDVEAVIGYLGGDYRKAVCLGLIFRNGYPDAGHDHLHSHSHGYSWTGAPGSGNTADAAPSDTGGPRDV